MGQVGLRWGRLEAPRRSAFAGIVLTAALFAVVLVAVVAHWPLLRALDLGTAREAAGVGRSLPWWVPLWQTVSWACSPWTFRVLAIGALVVVWTVRRPTALSHRGAVSKRALIVLVGGALPLVVKAAVDRPRPAEALVVAAQSSFPSAHAFGAAVAALCVVSLVRGRAAYAAAVAASVVVLLVPAARVCLAVHYVSDVTAGVLLGIVWFGVASFALGARERRGFSASDGARERSR